MWLLGLVIRSLERSGGIKDVELRRSLWYKDLWVSMMGEKKAEVWNI